MAEFKIATCQLPKFRLHNAAVYVEKKNIILFCYAALLHGEFRNSMLRKVKKGRQPWDI